MFKDILREVVESTDGAMAGVLMDIEGITVDTYQVDDATSDIETVGMEYSVILSQIKQAAEMLDVGEAREVAVQAENMTTVMRFINDQYFVAIALKPGGNSGKARYQLRLRVSDIIENLS